MKRMVAVSVLLSVSAAGRAEDSLPPSLRGVGFDQRLNQQVPMDVTFADENGRSIRLGDNFHDKPVILVLAYYRCPMLCTEVLNGLVRALLDVPFDAGKEFDVVVVSFDAREQPELAAAKKRTYVERYARDGAEVGWHFLTGTEPSIRRLTDAVGFRYRYDARNDQFAHSSGIMMLTPQGRIARYFYDVRFSPRDLRLGLVEASANRIGSPIDQVLLYCFHYDPEEGRYGPLIMNLVRAGGVFTVAAIVILFLLMRRAERRLSAQRAATAG
jgi:protein SCO1/2